MNRETDGLVYISVLLISEEMLARHVLHVDARKQLQKYETRPDYSVVHGIFRRT